MPDINNSLAAQIQVPQVDLAGTLAKAAQIKALNAEGALKEQELKYRQGVLDRNDQYYPSDLSTLADTAKKRSDYIGQRAGAYLADPTDANWHRQVGMMRRDGQINSLEEQQLRMVPPQQRDAAAKAALAGGQSATQTIEQQPGYKATSQAAVTHGQKAGELGVQPPALIPTNRPAVPSSKAIMGDDEAVKNGLYSPTPEQKKRGVVGPDYSQPGALSTAASDLAARNKTSTERLAKTDQDYAAAQDVKARVAAIDHDIESLGPAWMGAGAETKAQFAKTWNGIVETAGGIFGTKPNANIMFDPSKVATTEDFYKEQIRAGMSLINSSFGGGREAQSVVQMGKAAVAGLGNTYLGAKTVLNMIDSIAERQARLQEFKTNYRGPLYEAEIAFNKSFPPKMFTYDAITKSVPDALIQRLRANPSEGKMFDEAVHTPGLAKYILTGKL